MDILNKNQINYIVDKYFKKEHKKKYIYVLNQFKYFIYSSNLSDEDVNDIDIGGYLVYRINGMPPLVNN